MTLEIDLVRSLREPEYREEISVELEGDMTQDVMFEAADESERLRDLLNKTSARNRTLARELRRAKWQRSEALPNERRGSA